MTGIDVQEPTAAPASPAATPSPRRRVTAAHLERWALLGLLIATLLTFALLNSTSETFLSAANLRNVLGDQAVLGTLAIASVIPLIAREFDLSVGAIAVISHIVVAGAMSTAGLPLIAAIVAGIGVGALVGAINGVLVAYVRVNALIATLGISTVIGGVVQMLTAGNSIVTGISPELVAFGAADWLGLPRPVFVLVLVALVVGFALSQTPWGRYIHFVGSNRTAARLVGLNVDRLVLSTFVASGALSGLAGVLLVAKNGNASPQSGADFMLLAISAAFLGATALWPGRFNIPGTLIAIFFLAFSVNGLTLLGVEAWINNVFVGTALVVAVALGAILGRQRLRE